MKSLLMCTIICIATAAGAQVVGYGDDFELSIPAGVARLPASDAYDAAVKGARVTRHNACLPTSPAVGACNEDPTVVSRWRAALTAAGAACWQVPATDAAVATARASAFASQGQCLPPAVVVQPPVPPVVPPPAATVPAAPLGVSAIGGNGQAVVTFLLVPGATSYRAQTVSGPNASATTGAGSPLPVLGLINGFSYSFAVTAINSAGEGPMSGWSNAVVPVAPAAAAPGALNVARIIAQPLATLPLGAAPPGMMAITYSTWPPQYGFMKIPGSVIMPPNTGSRPSMTAAMEDAKQRGPR